MVSFVRMAPGMQRAKAMAKKTRPRKDSKKAELRPLSTDELKAATGGNSVPGNYKISSGGGGTGT